MMYILFSVILIAGLIFLSFPPKKFISKKFLKITFAVNIVLASLGAVILSVSFFICRHFTSSELFEAEWCAWAKDIMRGYYSVSLPLFLVLLFILLLSALISYGEKPEKRKKNARLRSMTSIASSAIMLFISFFYSFLTANATFPLDAFVLLFGAAFALLLRLVYIPEYFMKSSSKQ